MIFERTDHSSQDAHEAASALKQNSSYMATGTKTSRNDLSSIYKHSNEQNENPSEDEQSYLDIKLQDLKRIRE